MIIFFFKFKNMKNNAMTLLCVEHYILHLNILKTSLMEINFINKKIYNFFVIVSI